MLVFTENIGMLPVSNIYGTAQHQRSLCGGHGAYSCYGAQRGDTGVAWICNWMATLMINIERIWTGKNQLHIYIYHIYIYIYTYTCVACIFRHHTTPPLWFQCRVNQRFSPSFWTLAVGSLGVLNLPPCHQTIVLAPNRGSVFSPKGGQKSRWE